MNKKDISPYSLNSQKKSILFEREIKKLTNYHFSKSIEYRKILKGLKYNFNNIISSILITIPFLIGLLIYLTLFKKAYSKIKI